MCYRPSKFAIARSLMTQATNHFTYQKNDWGNKSIGIHALYLISFQSFMCFGAREQFKHKQANCNPLAQKSAYIYPRIGFFSGYLPAHTSVCFPKHISGQTID